ncbi:uncharacterized protein BYT42DRAFT_557648 [Radiomyces spectabilis]|uniref:uncharacterized protein n=1 Tax=Radiomyces spectabilis TaxID=64574 RepID=UPI002220C653|nr:uncharacterized protein BYT42DRAFT_557648 [Radiomyces spectabilis]KAI8391666.1 hypothetical protein BYT42DRAFT_557648 [Radiomyces spectabilis]
MIMESVAPAQCNASFYPMLNYSKNENDIMTAKATKTNTLNASTMLSWPTLLPSETAVPRTDYAACMPSTDTLDIDSLVDQSFWSLEELQQSTMDTLSAAMPLLTPWNEIPPSIKDEEPLTSMVPQQVTPPCASSLSYQLPAENTLPTNPATTTVGLPPTPSSSMDSSYLTSSQEQPQPQPQQQSSLPYMPAKYAVFQSPSSFNLMSNLLPPTPPVASPGSTMPHVVPMACQAYYDANGNGGYPFHELPRESSPPTSASSSNGSLTPPADYPSVSRPAKVIKQQRTHTRRRSIGHSSASMTTSSVARSGRRRAASHPYVASVVSLTAHEPVAKVIDGIEYISFLYSHDRLVKEYTVRTDIENVPLDDIPIGFRDQNAIYPRANVERKDYEGNRWNYETSCNTLGWKLCWLNQDQLCGRRGLIQRAVDSYRNRHENMRSRRVTRQEKVANGTLRKRRAKKAVNHHATSSL